MDGWGQETPDLKLLILPPPASAPLFTAQSHGDSGGQSSPKENTGRGVEIVQRGYTACWYHPWLKTSVVPVQHHQTKQPPQTLHRPGPTSPPSEGRRGEEGGILIQPQVCLVPGFGLDQWLTNDVYAVVLVDICWQNRSPVRHLEWN